MTAKQTSPVHPLVLDFLNSCLTGKHQTDQCETRLFDSDGSKYLLQRELGSSDVMRLSISVATLSENDSPLDNLSSVQPYLEKLYGNLCTVSMRQKAYNVVLELDWGRLTGFDPAFCNTYLNLVAAVHAHILGWRLRQALLGLQTASTLSAGILTVYCKPMQPILVEQHSTHCTIVYPIWLPEGPSKAYTAAFVQGFADVKRLGTSGDLPQCTYTAGPAPVPVPNQAQACISQAAGGFVSLVILPRHVKDSSLDDLVWRLLAFQEHVQYHVKCFKALIHSRMRQRMQSMILELGQAKKHSREVLAAINTN